MKNKFLTFAAALGLFLGGMGAASYFKSLDTTTSRDATLQEIPDVAEKLVRATQESGANSAPQVSQVTQEASLQLQYMQVRQNAEIIRLLTEINKKK